MALNILKLTDIFDVIIYFGMFFELFTGNGFTALPSERASLQFIHFALSQKKKRRQQKTWQYFHHVQTNFFKFLTGDF